MVRLNVNIEGSGTIRIQQAKVDQFGTRVTSFKVTDPYSLKTRRLCRQAVDWVCRHYNV